MGGDHSPLENAGPCEATSEVLPINPLVQLQDKSAGEKGERSQMERLQSGEPVETLHDRRPQFLTRLICIWLDELVLVVPGHFINVGLHAIGMAAHGRHLPALGAPFPHGVIYAGIGEILIFIVGTAYFGIAQGKWGQTLGKRVAREKVVRMDGSPVDMKTGILRGAYFVMPGLICGIGALSAMLLLYYICYVLGCLWGLADIICLIADRRMQRALHDRLAGTRVILLPEP